MQISNDRDEENIKRLFEQIGQVAFFEDPPFTHREILEALMHAIAGTIHSIACPGCRAASGRLVKETLPQIIDRATEGSDGLRGEDHLH
jgi:hypothetical protein